MHTFVYTAGKKERIKIRKITRNNTSTIRHINYYSFSTIVDIQIRYIVFIWFVSNAFALLRYCICVLEQPHTTTSSMTCRLFRFFPSFLSCVCLPLLIDSRRVASKRMRTQINRRRPTNITSTKQESHYA